MTYKVDSLNSSGTVTAPTFSGNASTATGLAGPIFYAYNNGNSNGGDFTIASGGQTTSISNFLTDTTINEGSRYYTSGGNQGRFVAPVAGYYTFQGAFGLRAVSGVCVLMFRKNGTTNMPEIDGNNFSASGYQILTTIHHIQTPQVILYLAANDYIEMVVFTSSGDIIEGTSTNNFSNFSGYRIY